jgi:hypothetical protein
MFDINEKLNGSQNPEEDILQVFKRAVNNGQTRLALEALVDVIDAILDIIIDEEPEAVQAPVVASKQTVKEDIPLVETKQEEPAIETPKKKAKETVVEATA